MRRAPSSTTKRAGEYVDFFAGAGALNYGHNPDFIKQRMIDHLLADRMVQGLDLNTVALRDLLETLEQVILRPRGLDYKMQLCGPSGASAVEAAIKVARRATGRTGIAAFSGGWHGMSNGCLAITGNRGHRAAAGVQLPAATFLPFEDGPYRMPTRSATSITSSETPIRVSTFLRRSSSRRFKPRVGCTSPRPGWLRGLRSLCDRHGVLLIVDDVQAGCGRTGDFFSFEESGIVPDVVCLSKSLSGYGLPLAVVLMKRELDVQQPGEHSGTFRGNQLAFVGATAALGLWRSDGFAAESCTRARRLRERLEAVAARNSRLTLRGRGFIWAIDFAGAGGPDAAARASRAAFDMGLLIERCGRDDIALKVLPPITIDDDAMDRGCAILAEVCEAVGP